MEVRFLLAAYNKFQAQFLCRVLLQAITIHSAEHN